jgi:Cd2+/Zn2+-exporting ATPase
MADGGQRHGGCESCIRQRLQDHQGIADVRLHRRGNQFTIDLEYDPNHLTLAEVQRELKAAEACLCPDLAYMVVPLRGMVSDRSEQLVESSLNKLPGVMARASYAAQTLRLEFDRRQCPLPDILMRLRGMGFVPEFEKVRRPPGQIELEADHSRAASGRLGRMWGYLGDNPELLLAIVAGILLLAGASVHWLGGPLWLRFGLLAGSYVAAGRYTGIEAWQTIRQFRFNIDVLMFAAAFGAAAIGHYEEGALLLFLFALGNTGEHLALERARQAILGLSKLVPDTAVVRTPDGERRVAVEEIDLDQEVIVRPFERIAVDGQVVEGASAVDQAPITGESIPVEKVAEDAVFAGTINGEGRLVVRVTRLASQSTLSKIIQLVQEAQTTKSPTQLFTDKVEKWYVPVVLIATAGLIFVPPMFLAGGEWKVWFYRAMGFLTAASPCALAIGTPAAVLCGIARSARMGVLLKGGVHLENLGRIGAIAFDKTGTLTAGKPVVSDVVPLAGQSESQLLALAATLERESHHPLAVAVVAEARARNIEIQMADQIEQVAAQGMYGQVDGRKIAVGKPGVWTGIGQQDGVWERVRELARHGKTIIAVAEDGRCVGLIALADRPRDNAAAALDQLRELGLRRTILLTGDNRAAAEEIGRQVRVDEVHAELLPQDKLEIIRQQIKRYGRVAMVGDGVNDAPALAYASIGIAMGGAGTDVAMETADVVLMSNDLEKLPRAISLSRWSRRIIQQNLIIALGVIAMIAPAAALGWATLGVAVLLHEGSTVVVVLNALRLLAFGAGEGRGSSHPAGRAADEMGRPIAASQQGSPDSILR